ncbi:MAG: S8 family serine peptidase [Deltaproteobacteria bacterium]|nr:S8 family serine peptidase [Deltaproteobacteria bacterium]
MTIFFAVFLTLFSSSPSQGKEIDPRVEIFLEHPTMRNIIYNPLYYSEQLQLLTHAPVTVRVSSREFMTSLKREENQDFVLRRNHNKEYVHIGSIFYAYVNMKGLKLIEKLQYVERLELDRPSGSFRPLDVTSKLIQADVVRDLISEQQSLSGHGITVADIDSGLDIFQPLFFRADGGYFSWIDADEDGEFTPGTDCVDLNFDNLCSDDEILHLLDARFNEYYGEITTIGGVSTGKGTYQVDQDYLYADTNLNGKRDNDDEMDSSKDSPGLGEPFFLADDVDKNGVLDPGEKVIMLSSSKVKFIYQNMRSNTPGSLRNVSVDDYTMHGTGVTSILAGGQRGYSRYLGIAPDVDLIHIQDTEIGLFEAYQMAIEQGADVILQEFAPWTGYFLDGSSNMELAMDVASENGVVNVNPAGNLAGSNKGWVYNLPSGESYTQELTLPGGNYAAPYIQMTLLWRTEEDITATLTLPGGEEIDLNTGASWTSAGPNLWYAVINDASSRSTNMIDVIIASWDEDTGAYDYLQGGTITLNLSSGGLFSGDTYIAGFVMDSNSGWSEGFKWNNNVSEDHLIGFSGTSDSGIALAAYNGRDEDEINIYNETQGQLCSYSGRGHRIDGEKILYIAAPANPLVSGAGPYVGVENYYNQYVVFGGTSGAGPHVAGAAALLKQMFPSNTGNEIRQKIVDGALVDTDVQTPGNLPQDELWGYGKLRIYQSMFGEDPSENTPPVIAAQIVEGFTNTDISVQVTVDDNETSSENLLVRWDVDYDGEWDTEFSTETGIIQRWILPGTYTMKAQVMDEKGKTSSVLVSAVVSEYIPDVDQGSSDDSGCSCSTYSGSSRINYLFLLVAVLIFWFRKRQLFFNTEK